MIKKVPEDTKWFRFKNVNPKGLRTTDCVVRGLAGALTQEWETIYREVFELGLKLCRPPEDDVVIEKYLQSKGAIKIGQPKTVFGTKLYGQEVCDLIQTGKFVDKEGVVLPYKNYYLHLGAGHAACIVDGKIQDIWNSGFEKAGKMWAIPQGGIYDYE